MIRMGCAGIPLSCRERTIIDSIPWLKTLGLNAMEIRPAGAAKFNSMREVERTAKLSQDFDVELSVHAPYYTNLASEEAGEDIERIMDWVELARHLRARAVVVHPGLVVGMEREEAIELAIKNLRRIRDRMRDRGMSTLLGLEVMGRPELIGDLEETLMMTKRIKHTIPILDLAHMRARRDMTTKEGMSEVMEMVREVKPEYWYFHISGERIEDGEGLYHTPIKKGDIKSEHFLEAVLREEIDCTIISQSPLLEHDAAYLMIVLERVKRRLEK
jgi:deoxyribonuclease-4